MDKKYKEEKRVFEKHIQKLNRKEKIISFIDHNIDALEKGRCKFIYNQSLLESHSEVL